MFDGNCIGNYPPPAAVDFAPTLRLGEVLTLVVGNDIKCKSCVARALADARGATLDEVTKAGARIFTRESSPAAPVVIDTTPLSTCKDLSRVDTARLWVSQNSLRKLDGKLVFVVCVIASTDPEDEIFRQPNFPGKRFSWLHLLACIFEQHIQKIMIVVSSEDSTDVACRRFPGVRQILERDGFTGRDNIIFFNSSRGELMPTIKLVIERIVYRDDADYKTKTGNLSAMAGPFLLRVVGWNASDKVRFGPWGPENVLVFGRTGSGKTTLAQMLTLGRLEVLSTRFAISSSIRGVTRKVRYAQGRGWRVIDTPGLGESICDVKSSVPTKKAERMFKEYVQLVDGTYSHLMYVWKRGKLDYLDEELWKAFKKVFAAEMNQMTVVVSDADQEWLEDNIIHLKKTFEGCESFVTTYFPLPDEDDDYYPEKEVQELRLESLKALEDELASLGRIDSASRLGIWSTGTQRSMMIRERDEPMAWRSAVRQSPALNTSVAPPHPSDYETARTVLRLKSWKTQISATVMPPKE